MHMSESLGCGIVWVAGWSSGCVMRELTTIFFSPHVIVVALKRLLSHLSPTLSVGIASWCR